MGAARWLLVAAVALLALGEGMTSVRLYYKIVLYVCGTIDIALQVHVHIQDPATVA